MKNMKMFLQAASVGILLLGTSGPWLKAQNASEAQWTPAGNLHAGRTLQTTTLLPDGRVFIVGGHGVSADLSSTEFYDPAKKAISDGPSMITGRENHTATLLPNGKVLVVGGMSNGKIVASAELYDPATNVWISTSPLHMSRACHTATLLPDGRVLVVGGTHLPYPPVYYRGVPPGAAVELVELYDPSSEKWSVVDNLHTARYTHTATLLPNGQVMVTGGLGDGGSTDFVGSTEIYDPKKQNWTEVGGLIHARFGQNATLLPNGEVLVTGGQSHMVNLVDAELFDPTTKSWKPAGRLQKAVGSAVLLPNGKVLVVAGDNGGVVENSEVYNPATNSWEETASLSIPRMLVNLTLLNNGQVLATGGNDGTGTPAGVVSDVELYHSGPAQPSIAQDTGQATWTSTSGLLTGRTYNSATLLQDGRVLITGGHGLSSDLASTEIYEPGSRTFVHAADMNSPRECHTATLLPNGQVLVTGGLSNGSILTSAELYNPSTGTWTQTGSLHAGRAAHTATLLQNGKVLVVGGTHSPFPPAFIQGSPPGGALDIAELYDPATGRWTVVDSLHAARFIHTATLLKNGRLLITGGLGSGGISNALASAELYDPETQSWNEVPDMHVGRFDHSACLLDSGKVLITCGQANGTLFHSAELFDPVAKMWTFTGSPQKANGPTILLPSKLVLLIGGADQSGVTASCELYDSSSGTWMETTALNTPHMLMTANLLTDGTVLVTGGNNGNGSPTGVMTDAEVYHPESALEEPKPPLLTNPIAATPAQSDLQSNHLITLAEILITVTICFVILTGCVITILGVWLVFVLVRKWAK